MTHLAFDSLHCVFSCMCKDFQIAMSEISAST